MCIRDSYAGKYNTVAEFADMIQVLLYDAWIGANLVVWVIVKCRKRSRRKRTLGQFLKFDSALGFGTPSYDARSVPSSDWKRVGQSKPGQASPKHCQLQRSDHGSRVLGRKKLSVMMSIVRSMRSCGAHSVYERTLSCAAPLLVATRIQSNQRRHA